MCYNDQLAFDITLYYYIRIFGANAVQTKAKAVHHQMQLNHQIRDSQKASLSLSLSRSQL